jgi:hypothetical protein
VASAPGGPVPPAPPGTARPAPPVPFLSSPPQACVRPASHLVGQHFFPKGEIRLLPGEIHLPPGKVRLPPVQGLFFRFKFLLGKGGVAGLALELLLQLLQPLHSPSLLDPLLFQGLVQGTQLGPELCCEGLPLRHGLLPPGQLLLPPGRLQLPGIHLLEVPSVLLAVPLELGPLGGELAGRCLGALLQLGAPVAEALVLGLKRLPLPQDRRLCLMKSLMGTRQHPWEGNWCCIWLGAGSEPPPKNHLRLLRSGWRVGARRASVVAPGVGSGRDVGGRRGSPSRDLLYRCDAA